LFFWNFFLEFFFGKWRGVDKNDFNRLTLCGGRALGELTNV
jgi:hypothetical protein